MTGCREKIPPPDNEELLTSVVWGETNAVITDPELYTCVFEPSGEYYTTYKGYETARYNWRLVNDIFLKFDQSEVEITKLTPTILEYRGDASFLGIPYKVTYHLQALSETVAKTIGFSEMKMTSAKLHGIIRSSIPSETAFEYGLTGSYGQTTGLIAFSGPVHKHISTDLTGLTPGTTYHYRIRIENEEGTYYGPDRTVRTFNDQTVTDADNNVYNTTVIGSQTWMAENLRTTKFKDGASIPGIKDNEAWSTQIVPAFCWPDNDSVSYSISGAIYNWYAVSSGKLCPSGWHVPSDSEWSVLLSFMAGRENELMKGDYWNYSDYLWNPGINQTGFSADMSRMRDAAGYFNMSVYSHLWSNSELNGDEARYAMIFYDYSGMNHGIKSSGIQVRCLKD
ncbi:MAG: FISUMP domain-containing protein [Bacteroidales bacterium]